jgi:hypothetical protein
MLSLCMLAADESPMAEDGDTVLLGAEAKCLESFSRSPLSGTSGFESGAVTWTAGSGGSVLDSLTRAAGVGAAMMNGG